MTDAHRGRLFTAILVIPLALLGGCGDSSSTQAANEPLNRASESDFEPFDANSFPANSQHVDNPWFPLKPGTRLTWEGTAVDDEGDTEAIKVVFTVTDLTKVIDGVRTIVCWDQDYADGEMVETEFVFFAQDKHGTVWHLGQYPEEWEDGKFIKAPCWVHGIKDGRAGIMMLANPKVGTSYSQGWAPSVDWTDRAMVLKIGEKTTVRTGAYEDVLVIAESSKEEPNAQQLKYYARGVGNVRVGFQGDQPDKETLELVKAEQLSAEELSKVRDEALKLEQRAYRISKDVYAKTEPMQSSASAAAKPRLLDKPAARTQRRPQAFTSMKDWNLKAENLSPWGHNPLYFPLRPGFRYIMESPDHPWGHLRIEAKILDATESFDVPGIGEFECAVVEQERLCDGGYEELAVTWVCIDKTTLAVYLMGELSWRIDETGNKIFASAWRVGEPDRNGMAEPGLLMPGGPFKPGDQYLSHGHETEAYAYSEILETGAKLITPAGQFENCVKVREYSLTNPTDMTDKWYCKGVGLVKDTSDGLLVASDALPSTDMSSFGKHHREPKKKLGPPVAKITNVQAREIALKAISGNVTSIQFEKRGGRNVYAVEIIADKDGAEWDVFVDIETGEVVGTAN